MIEVTYQGRGLFVTHILVKMARFDDYSTLNVGKETLDTKTCLTLMDGGGGDGS